MRKQPNKYRNQLGPTATSYMVLVGIITAILTAFYMTRQVVMTFFGEAKWTSHANDAEAPEVADGEEPVETHGAHGEFKPRESPATMLLPLVVLAGLAMVGGVIQLPSLGFIPDDMRHKLEGWLHPVLPGEADIHGTWADDNKWILIAIAVACAIVGIIGAFFVYQLKRAKAIEPKLFADGWNYDTAVSWFMGNPGRAGFQGVADFDGKVVDGAVNGVATVVRETAEQVRKGQTGYVRQYAGVIGIGVVLLLGWFVVVRGIL
jgi:NADH-quinone oxidoreductase subunit L